MVFVIGLANSKTNATRCHRRFSDRPPTALEYALIQQQESAPLSSPRWRHGRHLVPPFRDRCLNSPSATAAFATLHKTLSGARPTSTCGQLESLHASGSLCTTHTIHMFELSPSEAAIAHAFASNSPTAHAASSQNATSASSHHSVLAAPLARCQLPPTAGFHVRHHPQRHDRAEHNFFEAIFHFFHGLPTYPSLLLVAGDKRSLGAHRVTIQHVSAWRIS